jgi:dipeptidyl aminopeptidase/acylaminoacyl peptidase
MHNPRCQRCNSLACWDEIETGRIPMRLPALALLLAPLAITGAALAQGPQHGFSGEDLFKLEVARDPQPSPDGKAIAYVRQSGDIMSDRHRRSIWLIDLASGQQSPLASGPGGYGSPRWSPDGTRIAYIASVDAAIAGGAIDPDNLFVTGGSGGGVLTSWIVGKTHRFKAAATQKPVINWTSEALTMDGTMFTSRYWFDAPPWVDVTPYRKRSPLSLVGNVKTPTLVVVGSEDYRTPVSESEQYYAALQIAGVPTALVKVPGASHGALTARPSQSAAKAAAILAWFDRYRTDKPAASGKE